MLKLRMGGPLVLAGLLPPLMIGILTGAGRIWEQGIVEGNRN